MSRTTRTQLDWRYHATGHFYHWKAPELPCYPHRVGWHGEYYLDRTARDKKPWNKPDRGFKQIYRQRERAQVKQAIRNGHDAPVFRRCDQWNWT